MKKVIIGAILVFVILVSGKILYNAEINRRSPALNKKLQIVASFYPMYFFSSQIGGKKAEVRNITPASSEPHDYEPTTQDIARIEQSKMLVLNGGALETWGQKINDQSQDKNVFKVIAGLGLANKQLNEGEKTIQDPHVWLSPPLAKQEVAAIEKGFERVDPSNSRYYQENAKTLEDKLDVIDNNYKKGLQNCRKKDFVTSHAAFGYLADTYHLNQIAIAGVSPDEEPSIQKLVEITELVKKNNIKVIFFESLVTPKLSETIANETGAKTMVLDPIEGISDDGLKAGKNYLTIMRDNLKNLQRALECSI